MKAYVVYGIIIGMLFAAAHVRGYAFTSLFHSAQWSHAGPGGHK